MKDFEWCSTIISSSELLFCLLYITNSKTRFVFGDIFFKATRKHDAQDWGDEEVFTKQSEWTEEPMF